MWLSDHETADLLEKKIFKNTLLKFLETNSCKKNKIMDLNSYKIIEIIYNDLVNSEIYKLK
jgi:hypothetical protein